MSRPNLREILWEKYRWLLLISFSGIVLTGVAFYPYGIHRDSQATFAAVYLGYERNASWVGINNWMGWFTPLLWKSLYQVTGLNHAIGILHNLLYWISITIIFINLFPKTESRRLLCGYHYWFVLFSFFPPVLFFLSSITNNVLLLSFIAAALATLSFYRKFQIKSLIVISITILLLAAFIRRDAIIFIFPVVLYFGALLSKRRAHYSGLAGFIFLMTFWGTDKLVSDRIDSYSNAIHSTEVISLFDVVGMSFFKQELLIPEPLLQVEYQGLNRIELLRRINNIEDIYNDAYFYDEFDVTKEEYWTCGLTLKKALPVYLANWTTYLQFRANFLWEYFTRTGWLAERAYFDQELLEIMRVDAYPVMNSRQIKLQSLRMEAADWFQSFFPFMHQLWFYLALSIPCLVYLIRNQTGRSLPLGMRGFLLYLICIIWFGVGVLCIASVVVQLRYPMAYVFFIWPIFVYLLRMLVFTKADNR